jgi:CRISPR-associated protein Csb2
MTAIQVRFLSHRFHATPWGRHVNEGVPEWPPSPYRFLRALYDSWKRKNAEIPEPAVRAVFEKLASEAPRFALPPAVVSHTRSYLSNNTEDPNDKSLIFDGFVAFDPDAACYLHWPGVSLSPEERRILEKLLRSLNYLGRSESWVDAQVCDAVPDCQVQCLPVSANMSDAAVVPVACAEPPQCYDERRSWMDALTYTTAELLKDRRSAPPAMRFVSYARPSHALMSHVPRRPQRTMPNVGLVILSLDGPVLPLATATIEIAEQIRVRLMGIHKRITGDPSRVSPKFSGKDKSGKPLTGHEHLFMHPLANSKGRIDRILLYTRAAGGFDNQEVRAILGLRSLYQLDRDHSVRCVVTWKGSVGDPAVRPQANRVISKTPFVTVRHWRQGRGSPEEFLREELRRECRFHGLPEVADIEMLPQAPGLFEWIEFRRNRKGDPPRPGYGFKLRFSEAVAAPFSLGYGCHFGLGQFGPE